MLVHGGQSLLCAQALLCFATCKGMPSKYEFLLLAIISIFLHVFECIAFSPFNGTQNVLSGCLLISFALLIVL